MTNENLLYNVINWAEVDPHKMTLNIRGKSRRSCVIVFALWFMHEPATSAAPGSSAQRLCEGALRSLVAVQQARAGNGSFGRWQPGKRHHSCSQTMSPMGSSHRHASTLEELYLLLKQAGASSGPSPSAQQLRTTWTLDAHSKHFSLEPTPTFMMLLVRVQHGPKKAI